MGGFPLPLPPSLSAYCWFPFIFFLPPPPREAKRNRWWILRYCFCLRFGWGWGSKIRDRFVLPFPPFLSSSLYCGGWRAVALRGDFLDLFLLSSLFRHIFESSSLLPLQWWWWWMTKWRRSFPFPPSLFLSSLHPLIPAQREKIHRFFGGLVVVVGCAVFKGCVACGVMGGSVFLLLLLLLLLAFSLPPFLVVLGHLHFREWKRDG